MPGTPTSVAARMPRARLRMHRTCRATTTTHYYPPLGSFRATTPPRAHARCAQPAGTGHGCLPPSPTSSHTAAFVAACRMTFARKARTWTRFICSAVFCRRLRAVRQLWAACLPVLILLCFRETPTLPITLWHSRVPSLPGGAGRTCTGRTATRYTRCLRYNSRAAAHPHCAYTFAAGATSLLQNTLPSAYLLAHPATWFTMERVAWFWTTNAACIFLTHLFARGTLLHRVARSTVHTALVHLRALRGMPVKPRHARTATHHDTHDRRHGLRELAALNLARPLRLAAAAHLDGNASPSPDPLAERTTSPCCR